MTNSTFICISLFARHQSALNKGTNQHIKEKQHDPKGLHPDITARNIKYQTLCVSVIFVWAYYMMQKIQIDHRGPLQFSLWDYRCE